MAEVACSHVPVTRIRPSDPSLGKNERNFVLSHDFSELLNADAGLVQDRPKQPRSSGLTRMQGHGHATTTTRVFELGVRTPLDYYQPAQLAEGPDDLPAGRALQRTCPKRCGVRLPGAGGLWLARRVVRALSAVTLPRDCQYVPTDRFKIFEALYSVGTLALAGQASIPPCGGRIGGDRATAARAGPSGGLPPPLTGSRQRGLRRRRPPRPREDGAR